MLLLEIVTKNGMNVNYREKAICSVKEYLKANLVEKEINESEIYVIFDGLDVTSKIARVLLGSYQTPKYMYCYIYCGENYPSYLEIYIKDDVFCVGE